MPGSFVGLLPFLFSTLDRIELVPPAAPPHCSPPPFSIFDRRTHLVRPLLRALRAELNRDGENYLTSPSSFPSSHFLIIAGMYLPFSDWSIKFWQRSRFAHA